MTSNLPPLDILIYAHDGRGLGHASRSIAVGMAIRRLFPELRVLFVSGCRLSQELIGPTPLDWQKLPSYETEVIAGKSRGVAGRSGYSDSNLGVLRSCQLQQLVELYRPRLVLADHTPQGKHRELEAALQASKSLGTRWVLGVRGVVGAVQQVGSRIARELFQNYYHDILWYGDSTVLGTEQMSLLRNIYGRTAVECGYVSRLFELRRVLDNGLLSGGETFAGTLAIPWLGEQSIKFVQVLAGALAKIGSQFGIWRLFIDSGEIKEVQDTIDNLFGTLPYCLLEPPSGSRYINALLSSDSALVYGGYNSLMDVLSINLPAVVVMREMQDSEQQLHLQRLKQAVGNQFQLVAESTADVDSLAEKLSAPLLQRPATTSQINLQGAEHAAYHLVKILKKLHSSNSGKIRD